MRRMPFKFAVRKAYRRYAVSSRNSYVVCVHVINHQLMDCILTFDSTGRECFDTIISRLGITDAQYFGLRYVNRRLEFRWVDLDKPLKKQLDKHAQSPMLYFGIMFYVTDEFSMQDSVALYEYYINLKAELLEGKLQCSQEQAVLFAAYSLQAELGNYNPLQHDTDYLSGSDILPKGMTCDATLTNEIAITHQRLLGIPQLTAQLQYILDAQQLDGYGLEYFPVKDMPGKQLLIGVSVIGIFVKAYNDQVTVCFKWNDVIGFSRNKKVFGIETTLSDKPFYYQLEDTDSAKYLCRICNLQLEFYKSHANQQPDPINRDGRHQVAMEPHVAPVNSQQPVDALADQTVIIHDSDSSHNTTDQAPTILSTVAETSAAPTHNNHGSDASAEYQRSVTSQPMGGFRGNSAEGLPNNAGVAANDVSFSESPFQQQQLAANVNASHYVYSQETARQYQLPPYRPVPDYDTALRLQALARQQAALTAASRSGGMVHPDMLSSYSQPDIYQASPQQLGSYQANPAAVRRIELPSTVEHYSVGKPVDRSSSLITRPVANGPPTVVRHSSAVTAIAHNSHGPPYIHYRSPPPYPRQSNSTPELASPPMHYMATLDPTNTMGYLYRHPVQANSVLAAQSQFDMSLSNLTTELNELRLYRERTGPLIDALLTSNLQNAYAAAVQSDSRNDVRSLNSNSGGAVARQHSGYLSAVSNVGVNCSTYNGELSASEALDQQNVHYVQSNMLNGNSGSGRRQKIANPHYVTYVNCDELGQPLSTDHQDFQPSLMGAGQQGSLGVISRTGNSDLAGSSGSVASSASLSARLATTLEVAGELASDYVDSPRQFNINIPVSSSTPVADGWLRNVNNVVHVESDSFVEPAVDISAPQDERRLALENKLENQLFAEFETIPKKRQKCDCVIATLERNCERNRFKDVVPYDDNRVQLKPTLINADGYINASHIRAVVSGDNYWYIAAQSPMSDTVNDFWQMVWQYNVVVVVAMSTTSGEDTDKHKCFRYWPEKIGPQNALTMGEFEISVQCASGSKPYVTCGLLVRNLTSNQQRVVWQLQFTDWPDRGCPTNYYSFIDYLNEIEAIRNQVAHPSSSSASSAPVLVHCSAGVGRTGVVILTQLMKALLEHNQNADVPSVLKSLRDQRMYMVQTVTQYSYVYKTLVAYLQSSRLI